MLALACALLGFVVGIFVSIRCIPVRGLARDLGISLAVAAVFALTGGQVGANWSLPAYLYLAGAGVVLTVIDLRERRLPNAIVLPSYLIVGVLLVAPAVLAGQWPQYWRAWAGALILFCLYLGLALISPSGMGLGDVKLAGVLGLALGWQGWPALVSGSLLAFGFGAGTGIVLIATGRACRKTALPFGPFMLAGALAGLVIAGSR